MKKRSLIFGLLITSSFLSVDFLVDAKIGDWWRKQVKKVKEKIKEETVENKKKKEKRKEDRRKICQSLHDGAKELENAPKNFRDGLVELEKMPNQLAQGAEKISEAIAGIHSSRVDAKKRRDEIKSKNLSNLGMAELEKSLLAALDELQQALMKLANTDSTGKCLGGILCNFLNVSNQKKDFAQKRVGIIKKQITILKDKIVGRKAPLGKKDLPARMRRAGKFVYWKDDCPK